MFVWRNQIIIIILEKSHQYSDFEYLLVLMSRLQLVNLNFQIWASYCDGKQFTSKLDDILLCIEQHELYRK